MPRTARIDVGEEVYHVINRANGRFQMFDKDADYLLFEKLLKEAVELVDMRVLAYTLMPNHWHLALYPRKDGDLGLFMHRLTNAHTRNVHAQTGTNGHGHLYQGRYKSFLVDTDAYYLSLIKYIERNPVRAGLSETCDAWRWGSAWRRLKGSVAQKELLTEGPLGLPVGNEYVNWVNTPDNEDDLSLLRNSVTRGVPYGRESWVNTMIKRHHLESTVRSPGRPRKV